MDWFHCAILPRVVTKSRRKNSYRYMYYPYLFEYAVEAGLINDGRLVEPLIEPSITDLIAEFSLSRDLEDDGKYWLSLHD